MNISKLTLLISLLISLTHIDLNAQDGERKYELSVDKSNITWIGYKDEERFSGSMKLKSGYITMNNENLTQGVIFANAQSVNCKNCGNTEDAKDLMEYVRSSDFLNVQSMDFATFKMYKSSKYSGNDDFDYQIEGELTIIGYSQTITLPVNIEEKKEKIYLNGKFTMNRALWHLNNPSEGNPENHIGQTIELVFELEGELQ